jgi:hypothetical protein
MQLASGLVRTPGTPGVAFWAHIGGFVSGLILVLLLRPRGVPIWQTSRTRSFAAEPPRVFIRRRISQRGSVPAAGRPHRPASDIWG